MGEAKVGGVIPISVFDRLLLEVASVSLELELISIIQPLKSIFIFKVYSLLGIHQLNKFLFPGY